MKTAVLYDSTQSREEELVRELGPLLADRNMDIAVVDTARQELKPCIGCFGCWIKTPGICIHRNDGGQAFLGEIWDADYLILISRITWGGYSKKIKSYCDRMIPLLHPFFRKVNGEMHHKLRYKKFPAALMIGYGAGGREEEETFLTYTQSHRDNIAHRIPGGTWLWKDDTSASCLNWIKKEMKI